MAVYQVQNGKYFCVHGGISPKAKTMKDINSIDRKTEVPESGPLCDILWADPVSNDNGSFDD